MIIKVMTYTPNIFSFMGNDADAVGESIEAYNEPCDVCGKRGAMQADQPVYFLYFEKTGEDPEEVVEKSDGDLLCQSCFLQAQGNENLFFNRAVEKLGVDENVLESLCREVTVLDRLHS